nr:putative protein ATP11AUN [Aotus nancymaae]
MNPPEVFWVAQCRDSYPGCQPLKERRAWASSLKMDLAGLEGGPHDEPCDKPLIGARAASWDQPQGRLTYKGHRSASGRQQRLQISDTLSPLLCWRGAVMIVYVKVTVQTNDSNKLLSLLYW